MDLVTAEMGAIVWKLTVADGDEVAAGDVIAILESMKMEIPVDAPSGGRVHYLVDAGAEVAEGGVIAEITQP